MRNEINLWVYYYLCGTFFRGIKLKDICFIHFVCRIKFKEEIVLG